MMLRLASCLAVLVVLVGVGPLSAQPVEWSVASGGNGHYYEFITDPLPWQDALAAAASRSHEGAVGHLVTVTSRAELDFIAGMMTAGDRIWAAGCDEETEGTWRWVAGPEAGTVFWQQGVGTVTFAAWHPRQPDNYYSVEHSLQVVVSEGNVFNDYNGDDPQYMDGYVVEYSTPIPEPSTLILLTMGAVGLLLYGWRRRK